jgi:uncharacterized protein YdeI (YjbR/CyaY-like superfamily)
MSALPILGFEDRAAWAAWLEEHHGSSPGVWLKIAKKGAGVPSVTYAEALEVALCYGWIDGQKRAHDDRAFLQRFTPRRPRSVWSKVNREKVEALLRAGAMRPAGLEAVEAAKRDGRWDAAYDPASTAEVPADLAAELERRPAARAFFESLDRANRYAVLWRIQTARRPETRARRLQQLVEMLERGERIHP